MPQNEAGRPADQLLGSNSLAVFRQPGLSQIGTPFINCLFDEWSNQPPTHEGPCHSFSSERFNITRRIPEDKQPSAAKQSPLSTQRGRSFPRSVAEGFAEIRSSILLDDP